MVISIAFRLALRHLLRNPKRSCVTLFAMMIGVASSVILASIARGISGQLVEDAIHQLTGHIQIHASGFRDDPSLEHRFAIAALQDAKVSGADFRQVAVRLRVPGVITSERESLPITLIGIDPRDESDSLAGEAVAEGRNLLSSHDNGIVVGKKLLSLLKTELSRRVVVLSQDSNNTISDRGFPVVGIYDAELESSERAYAFVARETLAEMLQVEGQVTEISLVVKSPERVDLIRDSLQKRLPNLEVTAWRQVEPMLVAMVRIQSGFLAIWFSIVVLAVSLGLMNTIFMGLYERMKEIALIRAIGAPWTLLFKQIVLESFFLLFTGMILGTAAGLLGAHWLQGSGIDISAFAEGASIVGIRSRIHPNVLARDVVLLNVLLVTLGTLAALYPAWFGSRREPLKELAR